MPTVSRKHDVCGARAIWVDIFKRRPFDNVALEKDMLPNCEPGSLQRPRPAPELSSSLNLFGSGDTRKAVPEHDCNQYERRSR